MSNYNQNLNEEEQEALRQRRIRDAWKEFRKAKKGKKERRILGRVKSDPQPKKIIATGGAHGPKGWKAWEQTAKRVGTREQRRRNAI